MKPDEKVKVEVCFIFKIGKPWLNFGQIKNDIDKFIKDHGNYAVTHVVNPDEKLSQAAMTVIVDELARGATEKQVKPVNFNKK